MINEKLILLYPQSDSSKASWRHKCHKLWHHNLLFVIILFLRVNGKGQIFCRFLPLVMKIDTASMKVSMKNYSQDITKIGFINNCWCYLIFRDTWGIVKTLDSFIYNWKQKDRWGLKLHPEFNSKKTLTLTEISEHYFFNPIQYGFFRGCSRIRAVGTGGQRNHVNVLFFNFVKGKW